MFLATAMGCNGGRGGGRGFAGACDPGGGAGKGGEAPPRKVSMRPSDEALRAHWPEYLAEAAGLGLFMVSACAFGTLLGHPDSPVVRMLPDPVARRVLMGLAMGLTAVGLI